MAFHGLGRILCEIITGSSHQSDGLTRHGSGPPEITAYFFEAFLSSVGTLNVRGVTLAPGPCTPSKLIRFSPETCFNRFMAIAPLGLLGEIPPFQLLEAKLDCPDRRDHEPEKRVITLSHLEEVTITTDECCRAPPASPILPALCLPSVRRVNIRSIGAYGAPRADGPFLRPQCIRRAAAGFECHARGFLYSRQKGLISSSLAWTDLSLHYTSTRPSLSPFRTQCPVVGGLLVLCSDGRPITRGRSTYFP